MRCLLLFFLFSFFFLVLLAALAVAFAEVGGEGEGEEEDNYWANMPRRVGCDVNAFDGRGEEKGTEKDRERENRMSDC